MSTPQHATPKPDPTQSAGRATGSGPPQGLSTTYTGYVSTTHDALILFQACMQGLLHYVSRRPHDRERSELIRSGNIFIFNEGTSGIKRWTDGIAWSPSRILGNFLVYRQLEKPFAPGEKKRAAKRNRRKKRTSSADPYQTGANGSTDGGSGYLDQEQRADASVVESPHRPAKVPIAPATAAAAVSNTPPQHPGAIIYDPEAERALVGSLVDSYGFKDGGLIKKTMSVLINGSPHHLVSYYKPEDVMQGNFSTPSTNPLLRDLTISPELTQRQNFRIPPDGSNGLERTVVPGGVNIYADAYYRPPAESGVATDEHGQVINSGDPYYRQQQYVHPSYRPYPGAMPVYTQPYAYMPQGAPQDQKYYAGGGDYGQIYGHPHAAPYGWPPQYQPAPPPPPPQMPQQQGQPIHQMPQAVPRTQQQPQDYQQQRQAPQQQQQQQHTQQAPAAPQSQAAVPAQPLQAAQVQPVYRQ
ncbi:Gti1/Pac2 family-domain-containing protein [Lipomyces mesembrius]